MSKVREEAARWFARMRGAAPDDPERSRFEGWLMADPAHAVEYEAFAALWGRLDSPGRCDAVADVMEQQQQRERSSRLARRGLLGVVLAGAAGTALFHRWRTEPQWQLARHTGVGELARVALPDGSAVTLGARSEAAVHYSRSLRSVDLRRGEAIFDVAPDANRPFAVDAGPARVTVRGTRFVVARLPDRVRVAVDRGLVSVEAGPFWRRQRLDLAAGQVAELDTAGADPGPPRTVHREAADAFAFERGYIMFEMANLAEVAEAFSRHRREPVRAVPGRPGADPRITAAVRTQDVDAFLRSLPAMADVRVRWGTTGEVSLQAL